MIKLLQYGSDRDSSEAEELNPAPCGTLPLITIPRRRSCCYAVADVSPRHERIRPLIVFMRDNGRIEGKLVE